MTAQFLLTQKEVAAIQYIVLGKNTYTGESVFDSVANGFRKGTLTQEQYINDLIQSSDGQSLYAGKTDLEILKSVYTELSGVSPDDSVLQSYLDSSGLGGAIYDAISDLMLYNGFNTDVLSSQNNLDQALNAMMFSDYGSSSWDVWSVSLSTQEQVVAAYISIAGRSTDMSGLR